MSFDVSALTAYTEQNKFPLVTASVFGAKTQSMMVPQTGIKSNATINIFETDAVFQAGGQCSFNASGTTSFSQRVLTVGKIAVMESLCPKSLEAYYLQTQLPTGSNYEGVPFEQVYTQKKTAVIAKQLETAIWQGDTASGNANLARFDGLLKIIDAASGVVDGNPSGITTATGITTSNVRTIFETQFDEVPTALLDKDDRVTFCGWDVFRIFIKKLTEDNLFHYTTDDAAKLGEMYYPGTTLKIVAVNGLNGTNRIITARTSNLYFGTDMMNEEEEFEIFYAKEARQVRFVCEFKAGVQVAFPEEIVSFKLV